MGISLAPDDTLTEDPNDPNKPKKPAVPPIPTPTIAAPSTPVDRVKLATDVFNTSAASTQGAYDAASRDNVHNSAALGQVASGGLRTREGNLQLARGRDLDTLRAKLVNDATEGSIADASTAYQQALASSQQGLARDLGEGNLGVAQGGLSLAREQAATAKDQGQQSLDLAKKTADIDAQYKAGSLTLAQRNQALQELQNTQQFGLQTEQLSLAKASQALDEKVRTGQLSIAQAQQQLAELAQSQGNANQQQQLQLQRDQLAQTGQQFGLSLAQSKELATLADKTQNRQLDIASAQGRNSLLLELARIMGGTSGNVDPNFLAAVARALGLDMGANTPTTVPPVTPAAPVPANPYLPPGTGPGVGGDKNGDNGGGASALQLAQSEQLYPYSRVPLDTLPTLQLA